MLCDNLDRWMGGTMGRDIQEGGHICAPVADSGLP